MKQPEKILIIRFSSIGDILLTTPLIRALKKRLPDARIDYFTKRAFASLLKNNPYLDEVIELPDGSFADLRGKVDKMKREGGYDLVVDLHGNPRSLYVRNSGVGKKAGRAARNRVKRWLLVHVGIDLYGSAPAPMAERYFTALDGIFDPPIVPDGEGCEIFIGEDNRREASAALGGNEPYIVVAPSAKWETKRWMPERFAEAANTVAKWLGVRVVLLGDNEDRPLVDSVAAKIFGKPVDLAGKLSIMGAAAVIEGARATLGNDTGLMHFSGALKVPGVAIFGSTSRQLGFFPYKSGVRVVENNGLDCRPCTKQGLKKCPKGHFLCMDAVTVEEVVEAVMEAENA